MKDLETRAVNSILCLPDDRIFALLNAGHIKSELFASREPEYKFIREYVVKYNKIPSKNAIRQAFPEFPIFNVKDPYEFFVEQVMVKAQRNLIVDFVNKVGEQELMEDVSAVIRDAQKLVLAAAAFDPMNTDHQYLSSSAERLQTYKDRKENLAASTFTTGCKVMDKHIGGIRPAQLIVVAGDPKLGKTWFLVNMIVKNYEAGKRCLLISPEMTAEEIEMRVDSMRFQLNHESMEQGKLGPMKEAKWKKGLKDSTHELFITDATEDGDFTPTKVLAKIEVVKPDIVFIDSAYFMVPDGYDKFAGHSNSMKLVKQIKQICKLKKIPCVCVVQMNRDSEKDKQNGESALRSIYGGDHWAQGCDVLLRLTGMRAESIRRLVCLANRGGKGYAEDILKYEFDPSPDIHSIENYKEDEELEKDDEILTVKF